MEKMDSRYCPRARRTIRVAYLSHDYTVYSSGFMTGFDSSCCRTRYISRLITA